MNRLLLLLIPFVVFPSALLAAGRIKGTVTDKETHEPLVGANVMVEGTSHGAVADMEGEFSIANLPVGVVTLKVSYVGYATMRLQNLRIFNDLTAEANVALERETVDIQEVIILAERPIINKNSTNAVRITTSDEIETLPIRGVSEILALQAGIVVQDGIVHIRGGRADEVGFYLDGVSVTDPQYGGSGMDGLGGTVTLVQDALEEISVQSAGYEAEFGRANAGIVQQQLRTGGAQMGATIEYMTDNIAFADKNSAYSGKRRLGAYWYGYNEFTATMSGPVFDQKVRLFGLFNYLFNRDYHPQPWPGASTGPIVDPLGDSINIQYPPGILLNNSNERYTYTATLSLDFQPLTLRLSGSYAKSVRMLGTYPWDLQVGRVGEGDTWDGFGSLKATYVVSPTILVEASGGIFSWAYKAMDSHLRDDFWSYGDSVANAAAGFVWQRGPGDEVGRYVLPANLRVFGFYLTGPGTPYDGYTKLDRGTLALTGSLSAQFGKNHSVKAGGDYQRFTIRTYQPGPLSLARDIDENNQLPDGSPFKTTLEGLMKRRGTNNYGYDLLGEKYEGDDFMGPRHPVFASAYVQDKIEYADLVMNVGLRYDYIWTNSYALVDPARPELSFDPQTVEINPAGLRKTTPFHGVSPRLGISFPVTDRTVFHVQYAKLIQQSRLRDVNLGLYAFASAIRYGGASNPIGYDLRPTRTTQYEIGFTQQIGDFASFDLTGYYKDIKDQIVLDLAVTAFDSPYQYYTVYKNGDYATTKGVELTFTTRRQKRLQARASLSYQDGRGSGSYPNQNWAIVAGSGSLDYRPMYIAPLEYDNAMNGNVMLDYRFGKDDGGPILQELGASILLRFNSGHPYTRNLVPDQSRSSRRAAEPTNSSTTPWCYQCDLRIDKVFRIGEQLNATFSIYVINLFDTRNVLNVWNYTGVPYDDGFLSDPELGGRLVELNGPQYAELYRTMVDYSKYYSNFNDPYMYGPPRQIRIGLKLEL